MNKSKVFLVILFLIPVIFYAQKRSRKTNKKDKKNPKVGVVLSGGGAKGFSHIAVLKALEEAGVRIDYIGGTSMGAIVGGLYASGYKADELENVLNEIDFEKVVFKRRNREDIPLFEKTYQEKYNITIPFDHFKFRIPKALTTGQGPILKLTRLLEHVHDQEDFSQLPIPFFCIATNIETGNGDVLEKGFLPKAILASGAYPSLVEPIVIEGKTYIDGGIANNFPAKLMREKGADIVIGVDLGSKGLYSAEELKDFTKVLEQIVSFGIVKQTETQRKWTDILIQPSLEDYGVTDFEAKDSIISIGQRTVKDYKQDFELIAKKQKVKPVDHKIFKKDKYVIQNIWVKGGKNFGKNYTQGKMGIKPPEIITSDELEKAIEVLYATNNYKYVNYRLHGNRDGFHDLIIEVKEKETALVARLGLHYDDVFRTGALVNLTAKRIPFLNSVLSVDAILGENIRYNLNYFVDNGIKPSYGFNSMFTQFSINDAIEDEGFEQLDVDWQLVKNQFYIQSTLYERYAIGTGFDHNYFNLKGSDFDVERNELTLGYAIGAFAYLKGDTRDNATFATKGFVLDAFYGATLMGNLESGLESDNEQPQFFRVEIENNFSFNKNITLRLKGFLGYTLTEELLAFQGFAIGGVNPQKIDNIRNFYGLPFFSAVENNMILGEAALQFNIKKKHFCTALVNLANLEEEYTDISYTDYQYLGYGLSYGYASPLGPLQLIWSYAPEEDIGLFNVNFGYSF